MMTPRAGHSCAYLNSKVYVMGGEGTNSLLNSTEIYDTVSDSWAPGPDLWTGSHSQAVVYRNELYVAGGEGSGGKVWRLNSTETGWDEVANTAHKRERKFSQHKLSSLTAVCQVSQKLGLC